MAVVVGVLVELCAMGLSGRSIDSESCSTGDKTGARSESFLLTRSRSEGRVTSLGRNPSMQLSRLEWGESSIVVRLLIWKLTSSFRAQTIIQPPWLKRPKPDLFFYH
jgi:hypothetical protein